MKHPTVIHRAFSSENGGAYRWNDVSVKDYPATGTISRDINKQILFHPDEDLAAELRYLEVSPNGYSSLERHDHVHAVLILRGHGAVVVGDTVYTIAEHDLIYIPPQTWHQFHADPDSYLGFLCLVNGDRDRPTRPTESEFEKLKLNSDIGGTIKM